MSTPGILLVEDEADLLEVMAFAARRSLPEYEIIPVSNAADAYAAVQSLHDQGRNLAMAMVDHFLGETSGLDIVKHLRGLYPQTPVLMLTGQATPDVEARAGEFGVRVLWKPMQLKKIVQEIRNAIDAGVPHT